VIKRLRFDIATFDWACPVYAQETQTYSYDAKGRRIKVERAGRIQDGADSDYAYDAANNRTGVATTDTRPFIRAKFLPIGGKTIVVPQKE